MRYGRTGDGVLWLLSVGWSRWLLILARLQLCAIFRRKDVVALQVIGGVNVFGLFLPIFFACAFLARGVCNVLIFLVRSLILSLVLGARLSGAENNEGKNQENENTNPRRAEGGLNGSQAADPGWSVEIRTCHAKPTEDGGQRLENSIPKKTVPGYNKFFL